MTGFAVARRRLPQSAKRLDGLFDGLNLTPKKFTRGPGRLDLEDGRVVCHRSVRVRGLELISHGSPAAPVPLLWWALR